MRTVGITAEYNPFHRGHLHHLQQSLAAVGEDGAAVVVLSGDFVQRGSPAVFSKFARAEAAVRCGASLVIELPLPWSLSSAEGFARGAVHLLRATGVVDVLSFGCECGSVEELSRAAALLQHPDMDGEIRRGLESGISYAAAREQAAVRLGGARVGSVLARPNDLLGVEYIKACRQLGADFALSAVRRESSCHDGVGSASELRRAMEEGADWSYGVPEAAMEAYCREIRMGRGPVLSEALRLPLLSRLRALPREAFAALPDASEGIENRLFAAASVAVSPEEVASLAKSKRYALSRLRRMTMCAALGITGKHSSALPPYIRVLAMDEKGKALLRRMKDSALLPVVIKPASVQELGGEVLDIFSLGSQAHDLFVLGYSAREHQTGGSDWKQTPYIG